MSTSHQAQPKQRAPRVGEGEFPQVFGKYVLLRTMARGGMGELFLAAAGEVGGFEKLCVVKKVIGELADPAVRRRFLDEAKVVVRLNHANLVQVFDAGRVDEDYYLAMELVEGKDLRAIWNRCAQMQRRIPVEFAMFVVREVCRGLNYVHDTMGIDLVHRDISPPNILVSYHGQVKVTDFGLAKHAIKRELTLPGVVYGRYSYLAPEQARGQPADRRTDIFAAGIVLWEMLTGRQLFPVENRVIEQQALAMLRNPKIVAPSQLVPGIPDGLDRVVKRALAVERADRYQTAGEFRSDLAEVLSRHHPSYDIDRVAEFIREIFAHERRMELQDYASYAREDFSRVRNSRPRSSSYSITSDGEAAIVPELGAKLLASAAAAGAGTNEDDEAYGNTLSPRTPHKDRSMRDTDLLEVARRDHSADSQARMTAKWASPDTGELEIAAASRLHRVIANRYRLERLLGIGGMGAVYVATHLALGRTYALKILHQIYSKDSDITSRFMREARAATQTGHPNIIDVVDVGTTEDGEMYFVMELLDGIDLGQLMAKQGALHVRRAVHIARQVCRALGAAHEAGIIHRDLKSENIMIINNAHDPDFVKVLDFGICKHVDNTSTSGTSPGMVMGSPDYMAPEQAAGFEVDVKCDVYALGTVLFEMLTGQVPFDGRNAVDVLMKKGREEAPSLLPLRPDVPDALADVVARCLKRDRDARPPSMRIMEYELTRAIDGRAVAVAAALGMKPPARKEPEPSFSNPSLRRSAIEVAEPVHLPPRTVHEVAQAVQPPEPTLATARKQNLATGLKALLFVALGGALAGAWLFGRSQGDAKPSLQEASVGAEVAPTSENSTDDLSTEFSVVPDEPALAGAAQLQATTAPATSHETPTQLVEQVAGSIDASSTLPAAVGAETQRGESAPNVATSDNGSAPISAIERAATRAEMALAEEHWSVPPEGSLRVELTNLAALDPGHEGLARLRRGALRVLEPAAETAFRRNKWGDAVRYYRDIVGLAPDHLDGRQRLAESLSSLAQEQLASMSYHEALRAGAELQNIAPNLLSGYMIRGEAFERLQKPAEAAQEYRGALRIDPGVERARKGLERCQRANTADETSTGQ